MECLRKKAPKLQICYPTFIDVTPIKDGKSISFDVRVADKTTDEILLIINATDTSALSTPTFQLGFYVWKTSVTGYPGARFCNGAIGNGTAVTYNTSSKTVTITISSKAISVNGVTIQPTNAAEEQYRQAFFTALAADSNKAFVIGGYQYTNNSAYIRYIDNI